VNLTHQTGLRTYSNSLHIRRIQVGEDARLVLVMLHPLTLEEAVHPADLKLEIVKLLLQCFLALLELGVRHLQ
jgi:hypothetical protein